MIMFVYSLHKWVNSMQITIFIELCVDSLYIVYSHEFWFKSCDKISINRWELGVHTQKLPMHIKY